MNSPSGSLNPLADNEQADSARLSRYGLAGLVSEFLDWSNAEIVGRLTKYVADSGFESMRHKQTAAWMEEIRILRSTLKEMRGTCFGVDSWTIVLEYDIPRRGRRIDVILVSERVIYVLEFKTGLGEGVAGARDQVLDYVLELKDFHSESREVRLIPVVVADGAAADVEANIGRYWDGDDEVIACRTDDLIRVAGAVGFEAGGESLPAINGGLWLTGSYCPTPTIIEAAQILYTNHDVRDIAQSEAGSKNLEATQVGIASAIERARMEGVKVICFVTGVPGAGKTLAGLNAASQFWRGNIDGDEEIGAAFLSGNGPLVQVLVEALAQSSHRNGDESKKQYVREAKTFIQNIRDFLKEGMDVSPSTCPHEQVVVFDEAQRAWDADKSFS